MSNNYYIFKPLLAAIDNIEITSIVKNRCHHHKSVHFLCGYSGMLLVFHNVTYHINIYY